MGVVLGEVRQSSWRDIGGIVIESTSISASRVCIRSSCAKTMYGISFALRVLPTVPAENPSAAPIHTPSIVRIRISKIVLVVTVTLDINNVYLELGALNLSFFNNLSTFNENLD